MTFISVNVVLQDNIHIDSSFCGDYIFNHPISSTEVDIPVSFAAVFENSVVASLQVKHENNLLIALAGTSSGQLLKVNRNILS